MLAETSCLSKPIKAKMLQPPVELKSHVKANRMKAVLPLGLMLLFPYLASAQAPAGLGAEEFGMTQRQLVQAIEQGETLIAKCMREQGFQYVAAKTFKLQEDLLAPVEERIQQELFSRKVQ